MKNLFESIFKAYTEGIYADTPVNRKLGRVGMTYQQYAEKQKNQKEEPKTKIDIYLDELTKNVTNQPTKRLIKEAYKKIISVKGLEKYLKDGYKSLPNIRYENISKQEGGFYPVCGYNSFDNSIIVKKYTDLEKIGKDYLSKGWNSQENPILHELGHFLARRYIPSYWKYTDKEMMLHEDVIKKHLSGRAAYSQSEFDAEFIAGAITGKKYPSSIYNQTAFRFVENPILKQIFENAKGEETKEDKITKEEKKIDLYDLIEKYRVSYNENWKGHIINPNLYFLNSATQKDKLDVRAAKAMISDSKDVNDINYIKLDAAFRGESDRKVYQEEVDIENIYPSQNYLKLETVIKYTENKKTGGIKGFRISGTDKVFLVDGHHRAAALMLEGKKKIPMKIINIYSTKWFKDIK